MKTISLAMIVKNEEAVLARCLQCVTKIADEIIIVDTGSDDETCAIAQRFPVKLYHYDWQDDFAAARNYAFSLATMDYILWLDGDDVISELDQQKLLDWKHSEIQPDMVMMKYHIGLDAQGQPLFSYYRERLLKRSMQFQWVGAIHEAITPQGEIQYSEIAITHRKEKANDPNRNLRIFEKLLDQGNMLSPREQYYYARELYYHERYEQAIHQFDAFLKRRQGWVENCIDACRLKGRCHQLLKQNEQAMSALFESFHYDVPRAELLCDIGFLFYEQNAYHQAIYWYTRALDCKMQEKNGGFVEPDAYAFLPYLQLSVCYDRIQDHPKALYYHEQAKKLKPNHPLIKQNDAYFQSLS